jgi:hypothetical protein
VRKRQPTIIEVMRDKALFGKWFDGDSYAAWFSFLAALFALPMSEAELRTFRAHTGRETPSTEAFREAWLVCGRRAGKSLIAAICATYLAFFRDYTPYLAPGEVATVMIVAADRRQARVIMRYIRGFVSGVAMLDKMLIRETRESLEFSNRVCIEIHTASFRTTRGYTVAAAINDEIAFWPTEDSAEPDAEILAGQRPAMATIPGAILLSLSSPYARRGALWEAYKKHFGKNDSQVLVWQADSRSMNPLLDQRIIADAYEQDAANASAEYGAQFRADVESFVSREAIDACTVPNRKELPYVADTTYFAFVDPSGGSSDSMTLGIAHRGKYEKGYKKGIILDCLRERRAPFSPDEVVKEFCSTIRSYRLSSVTGDRYGGEWPRERFRTQGIEYKPSEKVKNEIYTDLLPLLNAGRAELLDEPRLRAQLQGLERHTSRGGKDSIDHAPNSHDDLANAVAGALVLASSSESSDGWAFIATDSGQVSFDNPAPTPTSHKKPIIGQPPTNPAWPGVDDPRFWKSPRGHF